VTWCVIGVGWVWLRVHVELPAKYDVIVNLSTATSVGIVITLIITFHEVCGSVFEHGFVPYVWYLRTWVQDHQYQNWTRLNFWSIWLLCNHMGFDFLNLGTVNMFYIFWTIRLLYSNSVLLLWTTYLNLHYFIHITLFYAIYK